VVMIRRLSRSSCKFTREVEPELVQRQYITTDAEVEWHDFPLPLVRVQLAAVAGWHRAGQASRSIIPTKTRREKRGPFSDENFVAFEAGPDMNLFDGRPERASNEEVVEEDFRGLREV